MLTGVGLELRCRCCNDAGSAGGNLTQCAGTGDLNENVGHTPRELSIWLASFVRIFFSYTTAETTPGLFNEFNEKMG